MQGATGGGEELTDIVEAEVKWDEPKHQKHHFLKLLLFYMVWLWRQSLCHGATNFGYTAVDGNLKILDQNGQKTDL